MHVFFLFAKFDFNRNLGIIKWKTKMLMFKLKMKVSIEFGWVSGLSQIQSGERGWS